MRYLIFWLAAVLALMAPARGEGPLVIVGGGLGDDNGEVFAAFLDALPAPDAPIAIIPAASGVPAQSASAFGAQLVRRGVDPARIRVIRLATQDDPATPEDESGWARNGDDAGEVARLGEVGAVWFTGGDQARIMATLLRGDGSATALLAAIRAAHARGAVIGGTSAGAAIMSDPMILQGDPFSLVPGAGDEREPIRTGRGLGFLRRLLVDQHFGERARLPRLVAALRASAPRQRIGLGIDEDTALVVAPHQRSARVVGRGWVTLLDARAAEFAAGPPFSMQGAVAAMAASGSVIDLASLTVSQSAAPAASAPCLAATSAAGLPDSQSAAIAAITGSLDAGSAASCLVSAGQTGLALRFWRSADPADRQVRFDILPVRIRLDPLVP